MLLQRLPLSLLGKRDVEGGRRQICMPKGLLHGLRSVTRAMW